MAGSKVVIAWVEMGISSHFLLNAQWLASHIASDNQVQLLAFSCGLVPKPGGSDSTDRRRGERRLTGAYKPVASGRWGSSTLVGNLSRRRITLNKNLHCLVGTPICGKG